MQELLASWFPHVTEKPSEFYESICETLIMTGWAGALMFLGIIKMIRASGILLLELSRNVLCGLL